jgi:hypothetical protein
MAEMDANQASEVLITLAVISFGFWIVDLLLSSMWEDDDE